MRARIAAVLGCFLLITPWSGRTEACTNFCIDTPDGPVFGCNLDLFLPGDGLVFVNRRGIAKEGFGTGTTGAKARWVSEYGSVSFNLAGREFAFGGMNEAGLVVSTMELKASEFPEPDERAPLPIGTWAQYILDTCDDIEDVIHAASIFRIEDSAPPQHFLISDVDGNCVAIEWFDGELECRSGQDLPVKAMTNMPYKRALTAYERGGPRWWWSNPGQSAERFAGAATRGRNYSAGRDGPVVDYVFETLSRVVAASHTKWSIVYDMGKREIWFRSVGSQGVKHLSLHAFDFACEAPVLMLDMNAPLAGRVEPSFGPYDHERNLAVFRALCAGYDIEISREAAVDLMHIVEGFRCAGGPGSE